MTIFYLIMPFSQAVKTQDFDSCIRWFKSNRGNHTKRGDNVSRGKKTSPETIYAIMGSWAITENYAETSRILNIPVKTVEDIVKKHIDKPEFAKLRRDKKDEFADKATNIINLALERLESDISDYANNIPVNHLTTVIGTLFDKRALTKGEATENTIVEIKLPPGAEEYVE